MNMSSLSSIKSQVFENCFICGNSQNLYTFPCSHKFCANCISSKIFSTLKSFSSLLEADILSLINKFSYLGCLQNCELSKQSLSKSQLLEIVKNSGNLNNNEKKEFYKLLNLSLGFFFGIKTQFFKCYKCNKFRSNIGLRPLVCSKCICRLYKEQTDISVKTVIFEYVLSEELFALKNDFISDYALVKCVENQTYECHTLNGAIYNIELAENSNKDFSVVLLRAIIIDRSDINISVEDIENTVQFVSRVRIIIN